MGNHDSYSDCLRLEQTITFDSFESQSVSAVFLDQSSGLMSLHPASAGDQHQERPHGTGHLRSKLAEQISACGESKPKRGSLSRVSDVVEAARKVGIAHESTGSGSHEVRDCRHAMPGVRAIHEGKADGVDAPRENAAAAGRDVARIFSRDHTRRKPRGLKADPFRDCIAIVPSKCLSALSPL